MLHGRMDSELGTPLFRSILVPEVERSVNDVAIVSFSVDESQLEDRDRIGIGYRSKDRPDPRERNDSAAVAGDIGVGSDIVYVTLEFPMAENLILRESFLGNCDKIVAKTCNFS